MNNHDIYIDWELSGPNPYRPLLTRVITAALAAEGVQVPCGGGCAADHGRGHSGDQPGAAGHRRGHGRALLPHAGAHPGVPPDARGGPAGPETGLCPLGDMVISLERAGAQAQEYGHSRERELSYLAVHSVLHLLGYDHMDEGPQKADAGPGGGHFGGSGVTRDHWNEDLDAPWRAQGQRRCR